MNKFLLLILIIGSIGVACNNPIQPSSQETFNTAPPSATKYLEYYVKNNPKYIKIIEETQVTPYNKIPSFYSSNERKVFTEWYTVGFKIGRTNFVSSLDFMGNFPYREIIYKAYNIGIEAGVEEFSRQQELKIPLTGSSIKVPVK